MIPKNLAAIATVASTLFMIHARPVQAVPVTYDFTYVNSRQSQIMLLLPKLQNLPNTFPIEGAVRLELVEGIPLFRASSTVQERIETLLEKQQNYSLSSEEEQELDLYEEIDDYLSFVNRTVRNLYLTQNQSDI